METLIRLLTNFLNDPQLAGIVFVIIISASVISLGLALAILFFNLKDPIKSKLLTISGLAPKASEKEDKLDDTLEALSSYVTPSDKKERHAVTQRLMQAGFGSSRAIVIFYTLKIVSTLSALMLSFLALKLVPDISTNKLMSYCLLITAFFFLLPNFILSYLGEKRLRELRKGFPDALDLLVVCVEAGLGLMAALKRVTDELTFSYPDLAEELGLVVTKIRTGISPGTALQEMVDRTGLEDIRGLASILSQSLRLGSSIADTLREYSDEFRDKRMQNAEEKAAKISTKMIFPLVLFMWPAFFVVAIGPAIIAVLEAFNR